MRGGQVFVLNINTSLSRTHFAVFCVSFYPPPALMLFATLCVCSPGSDSFHLYCHILENFLLSPFFSISNQFCYLRSDSFNYSSRERILCFTSLHIFTPPKKGNFYPITPFSTSSIWYVILIYYWVCHYVFWILLHLLYISSKRTFTTNSGLNTPALLCLCSIWKRRATQRSNNSGLWAFLLGTRRFFSPLYWGDGVHFLFYSRISHLHNTWAE